MANNTGVGRGLKPHGLATANASMMRQRRKHKRMLDVQQKWIPHTRTLRAGPWALNARLPEEASNKDVRYVEEALDATHRVMELDL